MFYVLHLLSLQNVTKKVEGFIDHGILFLYSMKRKELVSLWQKIFSARKTSFLLTEKNFPPDDNTNPIHQHINHQKK